MYAWSMYASDIENVKFRMSMTMDCACYIVRKMWMPRNEDDYGMMMYVMMHVDR